MAVVEGHQPKKKVSCDICGKEIDLSLEKDSVAFGVEWEKVSIGIYPNLGDKNSLGYKSYTYIEHACEECRSEFSDKVKNLIEEMNMAKK